MKNDEKQLIILALDYALIKPEFVNKNNITVQEHYYDLFRLLVKQVYKCDSEDFINTRINDFKEIYNYAISK